MSSTLASIILSMGVAFAIYRIRIYFVKKKSKSTTKVKIKESDIDMRFYSTPSFDFPNVQSELDLRCLDFGQHYLNETRNELQVTQYCKY